MNEITPTRRYIRAKPISPPAGVNIQTVAEGECRYPMGDPSPEMRLCGLAVSRGSYCARHARLAYRPAPVGGEGWE